MNSNVLHPPLVTLTSDFGHRDPYVAAMKGVLHRHCPEIHIEDLSHDLAPQDLVEAALFVEAAMPYYPSGTIHIVVVDPGVGTARRPLALKAGGQYFLCPDNGLMSLYLQQHPLEAAHAITNPAWMLPEVSATFHGRDIFACAAAMLATGDALEAAGDTAEDLHCLEVPAPEVEDSGLIHGEIIHIDRFGNCITNIHQGMVSDRHRYRVQAAATALPGILETYGESASGLPLALFGSTQRLEIAVRDGNAAAMLHLKHGAPVTLYC